MRLMISRVSPRLPCATSRKPLVGLVGEILVKFHLEANNHAVRVIEEEGCEAELPTLIQFFHNAMASASWNAHNLRITGSVRWLKQLALWAMERYEDPVRRAFESTNGKFESHRRIYDMAERSTGIAQMGNQAGEGWYLTAEMVDMIEHGCPNIICAQPFGCLPNHIIGKGMFRALRNRYPQANVVSVDYDPGASQVNQLNRIKLMISTAMEHNRRDNDPDLPGFGATQIVWDEDDADSPRPSCTGCALVDLAGAPEQAVQRGDRPYLPIVSVTGR